MKYRRENRGSNGGLNSYQKNTSIIIYKSTLEKKICFRSSFQILYVFSSSK